MIKDPLKQKSFIKINLSKYWIFSILFIGFFLNLAACKKEETSQNAAKSVKKSIKGTVIFLSGKATILKKGKTEQILKIKDQVLSEDQVKTGKRSHLVIQIGNVGLVRVESNTELNIESLFQEGKGRILLKKGELLTKIIKLKKGNTFEIKTPSAVAAVRGTEFSVEYRDGRGKISVRKGLVAVKPAKSEKEILVKSGYTTLIKEKAESPQKEDDKIEVRPISKVENLKIGKIAMVNIVPDLEAKNKFDLQKLQEISSESERKIDKKIQSEVIKEKRRKKKAQIESLIRRKPKSLKEIKQVFARIDKISLYNGRVIKGAIISRGAKNKILTINGIVIIDKKDIRSIKVIK